MVHLKYSAKFHELDFPTFPRKKSSGGYVSIRLATLYWHLAFSAQTEHPGPKITRKKSKKSKDRPKSRVTIQNSKILLFLLLFSAMFPSKDPQRNPADKCTTIWSIHLQAESTCFARLWTVHAWSSFKAYSLVICYNNFLEIRSPK